MIDRNLTCDEVKRHLRCSKGHLSKIINGHVKGVPSLPVIRLGRRVIVQEQTFVNWIREVEAICNRPA